jgi:hypothetical protein
MRAWLSVCALVVVTGCAKCADDRGEATPPPSAAPKVPYIKMSEQRRLRTGLDAGILGQRDKLPDAGDKRRALTSEAIAAGNKLHPSAVELCKDDDCKMKRCTALCAQWFRERMADASITLTDNQHYFSCIGACVSGSPDASAP